LNSVLEREQRSATTENGNGDTGSHSREDKTPVTGHKYWLDDSRIP